MVQRIAGYLPNCKQRVKIGPQSQLLSPPQTFDEGYLDFRRAKCVQTRKPKDFSDFAPELASGAISQPNSHQMNLSR